MNSLLIYGLPGVGKTTIMKGFITPEFKRVEKPFVYYVKDQLVIPGDYHPFEQTPFLGTDRLSMSIQPTVIEWIANTSYYYLFEGDRLFNEKFIQSVKPTILFIEASVEEVAERREKRGAQQNKQFLDARETKIENIKGGYAHYIIRNNNGANMEQIRENILSLLYRGSAPLAQFCPPTNQQEDLFE